MITRVPQLASFGERTLLNEVLQIPGRGGARGLGDSYIFFGAQAADETVDPFAKHAGNDFVLTFVQSAAQSFIEFRFRDVKINAFDGVVLGFEYRAGKILKPVCNFDALVIAFQLS